MSGYIGSKAVVVSSGAERKKTYAITTTTTSLTGASYTPNQVHVFHNGVRLVDGTDYTATDGTTVTLTSAAENGDEVVVVSYATFSPSDAYTKAETESRYVNITGDTLTGALTGTDLTLSGGIYLGGTGSDNLLDDYEEGLHTMTINQGAISINTSYHDLYYTKVGRLVTMSGLILVSSGGDSNILKVNLPFTAATRTGNQTDFFVGTTMSYNVPTGSGGIRCNVRTGTDKLEWFRTVDNGVWSSLRGNDLGAGDHLYFNVTYQTA